MLFSETAWHELREAANALSRDVCVYIFFSLFIHI